MSLLRSYLEANAILSPAQLEAAARHQQAQGGSLDTALLELGLLGAGELDLHLGRACGLPTVPARLLETGPTRPWGHVPKALLDIGWAMPLALEDGNVLVAVHPDLPDARLGQLYRQIRGFMPMVAPECCLAKLAAERSNGIVAPRFAMLMLDVLDALQARDATASVAAISTPVPEDRPSAAADTHTAIQPPAPGDTLLASAIRRLPAEDATSSGSFSAASSGTFAAVTLAAHESGSFAASSSGTFPDLRSVGAHAPGTRHGPEPTPRTGTPLPAATSLPPAPPAGSASGTTAAEPARPLAAAPAGQVVAPVRATPAPAGPAPATPVSSASPPSLAASSANPVPAPATPVSSASPPSLATPGPAVASAGPVPAPATPVSSASPPSLATPGPAVASASPVPAPATPVSSASPPSLATPGPAVASAGPVPAPGTPVSSASPPSLATPGPAFASASPAAPVHQPVPAVSSVVAPATRPPEPKGWQPEPPSPESERAALLAQRLAPARAVLAAAHERDRITEALVRAAAQIGPRVALFGVRREGLRVVPSSSALPLPTSLVIPIPEGSLLDRAVLGLIRLKLLTEPKLAAAVGRPLGIPCLFEPVFAQERGVLMLYIDRDGGQFDAIDHAAVRDLCDLTSTNLEALLRTRGAANPRPAEAAPQPTAVAGSPVTTEAAKTTTASGPSLTATPQAADGRAAAPPEPAPVSKDSPSSGPAAAAPVSKDSPSSGPAAAAPVSKDSPSSGPAAAAPVSKDSPTAPSAIATGGPTLSGGVAGGDRQPEVDVPQQRPGRAARAAKRQVISLINPIRRDNSGGHGAPPSTRVEPRAVEAIPDLQHRDPPLADRSASSPAAQAQPVPSDRPLADRSASSPAAQAQPVPSDRPLADRSASSPAAQAQPVPSDRPLADRSASSPAAQAQPVPSDRPLADRTPSTPLRSATNSRDSSGIVSGVISDSEAPTPLDRDAITRAERSAQPSPSSAQSEPPVAADGSAAASPVAAHSPAADPPVAADGSAAASPVAAHSPAADPPVAADDSAAASPVPAHSPAADPPVAAHSPTADPPVPAHSPTADPPVPADSLSAAPPGLHLPNLVAPPGRRGLGKKGDRVRHGETGLVMPDLRRPATPAATTPTLSIPSSLIAPTPLPGAQRRGSRTGLYPVPPRADEITLNMPRLVRDDVAARPAATANLSSGTATTTANLSAGTATTANLSAGTAATTADPSSMVGVVIPAELTRKPASASMPAAPASPPAAEPAAAVAADAATDPTATELSAETSATAALVETIADAMAASVHAADREDDLSSGTAPVSAGQAALGTDAAALDPDAVIEAYLNDPGDAEARAALGRLGPAGLERIAARFPGPIELGDQSDARSFPPPSAHGPLLRACVEIGPVITPYILALLDYPRPQLRFYAAFVFQELRDPRSLRALAEHAFDPDADVRLIATRVLESYSRDPGFVAATELVRAELRSRDRERALLAAEAAGTLRDTQAVYTLIELLSVRDKQVRETALEALCSITAKHLGYRPAKWRAWYDEHGQETRVEWVIEALRHRDAAVRRWAADELVRITGHRVGAPAGEKMTAKYLYQAWQQWWAAGTADRGS